MKYKKYQVLAILLVGVGLTACQSEQKTQEAVAKEVQSAAANSDWVNEEILNQLVAIRGELESLRKDVASLSRAQVNTSKSVEIELDAARSIGSDNAPLALIEFINK